MGIDYRVWSAQRSWGLYRVIFPVAAGVIMLVASLLPWLVDPLGERFSAWALPVDLGWQMRFSFFNYGIVNLVCACYLFFTAVRAWRGLGAGKQEAVREAVPAGSFVGRREMVRASLLCLVPVALFFFQYLLIDMSSATELVRHQVQASLIKLHLSYESAATFFPITDPASLDPLEFSDRATVIINNLGVGIFLPIMSVIILFFGRLFWPEQRRVARGRAQLWWLFGGALVLGIILGRGPSALLVNYQAEHALSVGEYAKALQWLDTARLLNPELDQMSSYHRERGQAWYYLRPGEENEEAKLFLSTTYEQQKDYLSAYQELLSAWYEYGKDPWVQDELSRALTQLAEQNKPATGAATLNTRLGKDNPALPWLQQLVQIDATNAYGYYLLGRIYYDEHNYDSSFARMQSLLDLVQNNDFQSAAYTYLGLNSEMLGASSQARTYLFKAVDLDAGYHNNTARQELSGLR